MKKAEFLEVGKQILYFTSSENMKQLDDETIDVIVTSPPYNIGKYYSADDSSFHNDTLPDAEYLNFLSTVFKECARVMKKTGIFFLNFGETAKNQGMGEKVVSTATSVGYKRLQTIIWVKSLLGRGHYTPSGGDRRLNNIWEYVYVFVKDLKNYTLSPKAIGIPYADKSNIGRYSDTDRRDAGNVWLIPYTKTSGHTVKKGHEAPFPIELPYRCIKLVPEAVTVLDPFAGTGSTLAAAEALELQGYGYELYPRRDVIEKRIMEAESFRPMEHLLIPHLEETVKTLVEGLNNTILNKSQELPWKMQTQRQRIKMEIVLTICEGLGISNPLVDEIRENLGKDVNKLGSKGVLEKYFDAETENKNEKQQKHTLDQKKDS